MSEFDSNLKSSKIAIELRTSKNKSKKIGSIVGTLVVKQLLLDLELESAHAVEDRLVQSKINIETTLAICLFRARTGSYPESLSDLVPRDLKKIPFDIFSDDSLVYQRTRHGFKLYSFGRNLIDESGIQNGDDMIIEMTLEQ